MLFRSQSPDSKRTLARHEESFDFNRFIQNVSILLKPNGTFSLIIPSAQAKRLEIMAMSYGLYLVKRLLISTKPYADDKRQILIFRFIDETLETEKLVIELARHIYSEEYVNLTKPFYARM